MYNICVIGKDTTFSANLAHYLHNNSAFRLAISVSSYEAYIHQISLSEYNDAVDLILCDLSLDDISGIAALVNIKSRFEGVQVIMVADSADQALVFQALYAGAAGFVLKDTAMEILKFALLEVMEGGVYISPKLAREIFSYFNNSLSADNTINRGDTQSVKKLTLRELEVLSYLQKGATNKMIAEKIFISKDTVKYHIKNIYSKLQIKSRKDLYFKGIMDKY